MRQRNRTTNDDTGIVRIGSKTFIYLDKTIRISTKATYTLGGVDCEVSKQEELEPSLHNNSTINDIKTETKNLTIRAIRSLIKHEVWCDKGWNCKQENFIENDKIDNNCIENAKGTKTIEKINKSFILVY